MNCLDCQELVQRCLDGESVAPLTPPLSPQGGEGGVRGRAELDQHLSECVACRDLCAAAQRLVEGLRLLTPPPTPLGLAERIQTCVVVNQRHRQRVRRLLATAGVAASLLLAALASYFGLRAVPLAETPHQPPEITRNEPAPALSAPPALHHRIKEAGEAVVALTRRTADETMGQSRLLLPRNLSEPSLADSRITLAGEETPEQSLREVQDGMSAGLEPVMTSARRAVALFLQEIPAAEPPRKP